MTTVLIVEDDVVVADMYRLALTAHGFEVRVAHDGQAGLQAIVDGMPDLVFLDIRMPKMDGLEVLRRVAADERTCEIPIVMLSNFDDSTLVTSSLNLGAKQYLVKVDTFPAELANVVMRWTNVRA